MSDSVWQEFGFKQSPYRVTPLEVSGDDEPLFTPRIDESSELLTLMDCPEGAVVVVSGDAGIGKTSFVNVQQYWIETGKTVFGPRLIACRSRTPLTEWKNSIALARAIVENAIDNIEKFCQLSHSKVPSQTAKVRDWISSRESTTGFQIGIGPIQFGKTITIPPVSEAGWDTWRTVLQLMSDEVREELQVKGFIVCLENVESVPIIELVPLLMHMRDSFFAVKGVWWIIIGQSGLYWRIESRDRRVSQRIAGKGIELAPLVAESFHDLIERRVQHYRALTTAKSPLSKNIHTKLFAAAVGEVRFALDTADMLMHRIVARVRASTAKRLGSGSTDRDFLREQIRQSLKALLIDQQVPDELAEKQLKDMAVELLKPQLLNSATVSHLGAIRTRAIHKSDYSEFEFSSEEDFENDFLIPMRQAGLLAREGLPGSEEYFLKGFARLCFEYDILAKVTYRGSAR